MKTTIIQQDLIKLKSFNTAKETIKKKKKKKTIYRMGENSFKLGNCQGLYFQNLQTTYTTQQQKKKKQKTKNKKPKMKNGQKT